MIFTKTSGLNLWKYKLLSDNKDINHFVTGKGYNYNGISSIFNLGKNTGEKESIIINNRQKLAEYLNIKPQSLYFPVQTHGNNVALISKDNETELEDTDAIITREKQICIGVLAADCVPILLYDPVERAIGAVHAGWRGTTKKILTRTLEHMKEKFGTDYKNLKVAIGPSICPEVYEVGQDVVTAASIAFDKDAIGLLNYSENKVFFNLGKANVLQVLQMGVPEKSIEVAHICTLRESELFFSARREGITTGRFASCIMLN